MMNDSGARCGRPHGKTFRRIHFLILCVLTFGFQFLMIPVARAQQLQELRGTVVDYTGSSVQNAQIELQTTNGTRLATTNEAGEFQMPDVDGGTLLARFPGFASVSMEVTPELIASGVQIRLVPASNVQRIEVTAASDDRVPAVPASEFSIPKDQIQVSGAATPDEILRQTPGFSLFRRSGSLFANPTTRASRCAESAPAAQAGPTCCSTGFR